MCSFLTDSGCERGVSSFSFVYSCISVSFDLVFRFFARLFLFTVVVLTRLHVSGLNLTPAGLQFVEFVLCVFLHVFYSPLMTRTDFSQRNVELCFHLL